MTNIFNVLAVLSALLTAYLYWLGLEQFYFWYYPWFDTPLHLAGGLTIGLWGAGLCVRRACSLRQASAYLLILALLVSIIWELFEYVSGLTTGKPDFWFDTITDLGTSLLGTALACGLYFIAIKYRSTSSL